jgi:hypothetical protein
VSVQTLIRFEGECNVWMVCGETLTLKVAISSPAPVSLALHVVDSAVSTGVCWMQPCIFPNLRTKGASESARERLLCNSSSGRKWRMQ